MPSQKLDRRARLIGVSLTAVGLTGYSLARGGCRSQAAVFIARHQRYDGSLVATIRDGLLAAGVHLSQLRGQNVLLKPNLVEPTRQAPQLTTHPAVVLAAAEVFRMWGADVVVGEGPGHERDTEWALVESGMQDALDRAGLAFADLNYDELVWAENVGKRTNLSGFCLPRAVAAADLIVSLPKLKTHHWVGVTAAMKNMFGVLPGICHGWPKNVLHLAGIPETVFDINATLPKTISIVDAIECMEGDGPIMGPAKQLGDVLVGANLAAVDATACRLMELDPWQVPYLRLAADWLGPVADHRILQRGENWQSLASPFQIAQVPHLKGLSRRLA